MQVRRPDSTYSPKMKEVARYISEINAILANMQHQLGVDENCKATAELAKLTNELAITLASLEVQVAKDVKQIESDKMAAMDRVSLPRGQINCIAIPKSSPQRQNLASSSRSRSPDFSLGDGLSKPNNFAALAMLRNAKKAPQVPEASLVASNPLLPTWLQQNPVSSTLPSVSRVSLDAKRPMHSSLDAKRAWVEEKSREALAASQAAQQSGGRAPWIIHGPPSLGCGEELNSPRDSMADEDEVQEGPLSMRDNADFAADARINAALFEPECISPIFRPC